MTKQSLTEHILAADPAAFARATQSPFLAAAARGELPKDVLGQWLANDRMYIHAYIGGIGHFLGALQLPTKAADSVDSSIMQLLDWSAEALSSLRQEEKFFVDTAAQYGLTIDLDASGSKLPGLTRFQHIFGAISHADHNHHMVLPWLEAAIVFYATEKCYLDAWSWAKSQMKPAADGKDDADGGALRNKFIPQWSNDAFAIFVERLGKIIDDAVVKEMQSHGDGVQAKLFERALKVWHDVLVAEEAFWPQI
jgi:thiaminase